MPKLVQAVGAVPLFQLTPVAVAGYGFFAGFFTNYD